MRDDDDCLIRANKNEKGMQCVCFLMSPSILNQYTTHEVIIIMSKPPLDFTQSFIRIPLASTEIEQTNERQRCIVKFNFIRWDSVTNLDQLQSLV